MIGSIGMRFGPGRSPMTQASQRLIICPDSIPGASSAVRSNALPARLMRKAGLLVLAITLAGCQAPLARLKFAQPVTGASLEPQRYDIDRDGKHELVLTFDAAGKINALSYDEDENGTIDRVFRLSDYSNDGVPHVVILLDSVPF